ncbi:MAG: hypothetical protein Q7V05_14440, partial [Methanoregula sp.]|nr:hypothetical protein [Methanoregula sp.]
EAVAQFEKINPIVEFAKNGMCSDEFSTIFWRTINTNVELKRSVQRPRLRGALFFVTACYGDGRDTGAAGCGVFLYQFFKNNPG